MPKPKVFYGNMFPGTKWSVINKPIIIVDGELYDRCIIKDNIRGELAYGVGLKEQDIERISDLIKVVSLKLYEIKSTTIQSISRITILRDLEINWSTKINTLEYLCLFDSVENLIITDFSNIVNFNGIQNIKGLKYLEINGGNTGVMKYETFKHIGLSESLEELTLTNVMSSEETLDFIINMRSLRILNISPVWPTREYAILSRNRPDIKCDMFNL